MKVVFISSSGTELGKTLVTTALVHQLRRAGRRVRALKPVISGFSPETAGTSDTVHILRSLDVEPDPAAIEAVSPWRFAAPLAPDMAAAREGRTLDFAALVAFCRSAAAGAKDVLLIEGVGGVMVPLTEKQTVLDWMAALGAPVVLVVGAYLGTISHTLTAAGMVAGRGLRLAGIVVSEREAGPVPLAETCAAIARFVDGVPVVPLPNLGPGEAPWRRAPDLLRVLELAT